MKPDGSKWRENKTPPASVAGSDLWPSIRACSALSEANLTAGPWCRRTSSNGLTGLCDQLCQTLHSGLEGLKQLKASSTFSRADGVGEALKTDWSLSRILRASKNDWRVQSRTSSWFQTLLLTKDVRNVTTTFIHRASVMCIITSVIIRIMRVFEVGEKEEHAGGSEGSGMAAEHVLWYDSFFQWRTSSQVCGGLMAVTVGCRTELIGGQDFRITRLLCNKNDLLVLPDRYSDDL